VIRPLRQFLFDLWSSNGYGKRIGVQMRVTRAALVAFVKALEAEYAGCLRRTRPDWVSDDADE
jgi:hypothetical protein